MTQGTVKWFNAEKGFASIAERRAAGLADKRMALAQAPRARAHPGHDGAYRAFGKPQRDDCSGE